MTLRYKTGKTFRSMWTFAELHGARAHPTTTVRGYACSAVTTKRSGVANRGTTLLCMTTVKQRSANPLSTLSSFPSTLDVGLSRHLSHPRISFSNFSTNSNSDSQKDGEMKESSSTTTPTEDNADPRVNQPPGTATVTFVETEEGIIKSDDDDKNEHDDDDDGVANLPHPLEHYTTPIVVRMPDMSNDDDDNNTVDKWYKQPGDVVHRNDVLCDIGTPDFTFGMVTDDEDDAVMGELHVEEGTKVKDGTPICTIYHYDPSHASDKEE